MTPALKNYRNNKIFIGVCVLFIISLFIPTPYYLFQPGSVEELSSKVTVEDGTKSVYGNLYLTTVLSTRANNIYYLAYSLIAPHTTLKRSETVRGNMSDAEYKRWLTHLMTKSQQQAMIAGLRAAGENVTVTHKGIVVRNISEQSNAKGIIEIGDQIVKVDHIQVAQLTDLQTYLQQKKSGDIVSIEFTRDGKRKMEKVELIPMDHEKLDAGIGIAFEEAVDVDSLKEVSIRAGEIGGPSAGLMFSLEIYNQLNDGKITKGYEIAGTGTIDEDGIVGQIGGIREKIAAVEQAGVDIFFCPKDVKENDTNEKEVKEEIDKHGYSVEVVPVSSLQEAIDYLEKLPEKS